MSEYPPARMDATRYQVFVIDGEVSTYIYFGKIYEGKRDYCMRVSPAMIKDSLADGARQVTEQTAELIKERDALQEERDVIKEERDALKEERDALKEGLQAEQETA